MIKSTLVYIIDLYKKYVSPRMQRHCRFYPTCSEYAQQAILKYGVWKGMFLSVKRLLRCNPLFHGGYDQVE